MIKQIQTIATNTYISPNMVAQSIVNQFARSGRMDGAIATVKNALRDRRDAVVTALERELPEAKFAAPSGGYFMWVELPEAIDVAELEKAAAEREVLFVKGTDFLLEGGQNTLRLAYSGVTPEQIDEGITKLAEAVRSLGVPRHSYGDDPSQYGVLYGEGPVAVLIHGGFWKAEYDLDADGRAGRGPGRARLGGVEHRVPAARQRRRRAGDARRRGRGDRPPRRRSDVDLSRVVTIGHSRRRAPRGVGGDARESARGGHRRRLPGGRARPRSGRASCGSPTASSSAS